MGNTFAIQPLKSDYARDSGPNMMDNTLALMKFQKG